MFAISHSLRCFHSQSFVRTIGYRKPSSLPQIAARYFTNEIENPSTKTIEAGFTWEQKALSYKKKSLFEQQMEQLREEIISLFNKKLIGGKDIREICTLLEKYRKMFHNKENLSIINNTFARQLSLKAINDAKMTEILIQSGIFDLIPTDIIYCKTRYQAEMVADNVGGCSTSDIQEYLVTNAIIREDCPFIQEMLDNRSISKDEFKRITIPLNYPFNIFLGQSPLLFAIEKDNLELVQLLIDNGFSPEAKLKHLGLEYHLSFTPITIAFNNGSTSIVDILDIRGANPQTEFDVDYFGPNQDGPRFKFKYEFEELIKFDIQEFINTALNLIKKEVE